MEYVVIVYCILSLFRVPHTAIACELPQQNNVHKNFYDDDYAAEIHFIYLSNRYYDFVQFKPLHICTTTYDQIVHVQNLENQCLLLVISHCTKL